MLNDLYFKITCNISPHFLGPVGGLKIDGPLYYLASLAQQDLKMCIIMLLNVYHLLH